MNLNEVNTLFIDKVKSKIRGSVVETIEDILSLSKEAIYRRLRGDVIFSYPEAVLLAQKLDISLDELNFQNSEEFHFKISKASKLLGEEAYVDYITMGVSDLSPYLKDVSSHLHFVGSGIPLSLVLKYNSLSKFRYFKWHHENRGLEINKSKFSQTIMPAELYELAEVFLVQLRQINTTLILSDKMCEFYLRDLKHFILLGLVDQVDIDLIRDELHKMIDEFEGIVASGTYKNGAKVSVYLTDINIDSTFGYFDSQDLSFAFSKMFGMNYATTRSKKVTRMYRDALDDLKDYGTLISQSGATVRSGFFNEQHRLIDDFLVQFLPKS
ncbi:MAG: hypothetical protein RL662_945 [Bacteroidota bacterium]|jgi:hypothetical protein